ncbi:DUF1858 domain-containing protein, partial [bacterium]|nr:DUF1858 domain-containing protein [bacterium]
VTVGFISLMIVGVAAKVVPTLNGVNIKRLSSLWAPFVLINTGCFIRVAGQTLTDFSPSMFPIAGVSGLLEVTGLALWSFHIVSIIMGRARIYSDEQGTRQDFKFLQAGAPIQGFHIVSDILDAHPDLLPIFLSHGFTPLQNPVMRKTLAKSITLESACRLMNVDQETLIQELNQAIKQNDSPSEQHLPLYQIELIHNN